MKDPTVVEGRTALQFLHDMARGMIAQFPGLSLQDAERITHQHADRILATAASQLASLKEEEGGTGWPGVVDTVLSMPRMLETVPGLMGAVRERLMPHSPIPNVDKSISGLANKYMPEFVGRAEERQGKLLEAINKELDVPEAHGTVQHLEDAAGYMLSSPWASLPKAAAAKGPALTRAASSILGSAPEYMFPTIRPSVSNYVTGTAFGGALGRGAEYLTDRAARSAQEDADSERFADAAGSVADRYLSERDAPSPNFAEGGRIVAFSKLKRFMDQAAKEHGYKTRFDKDGHLIVAIPRSDGIEVEEKVRDLGELQKTLGFGKGGRVARLREMTKALALNPHSSLQRVDNPKKTNLGDPVEDIKYAANAARATGQMRPSEHIKLNQMLDRYLEGRVSDQTLADRLIDLHGRVFGNPELLPARSLTPPGISPPPLGSQIERRSEVRVPSAMGVLDKFPFEKAEGGRVTALNKLLRQNQKIVHPIGEKHVVIDLSDSKLPIEEQVRKARMLANAHFWGDPSGQVKDRPEYEGGDSGIFLGGNLVNAYHVASVKPGVWVLSLNKLGPQDTRPLAQSIFQKGVDDAK